MKKLILLSMMVFSISSMASVITKSPMVGDPNMSLVKRDGPCPFKPGGTLSPTRVASDSYKPTNQKVSKVKAIN